MIVSKSAQWYLERRNLVPTLRAPTMRSSPGSNIMHSAPVTMPLPVLQQATQGDVIPDRGVTLWWPENATS